VLSPPSSAEALTDSGGVTLRWRPAINDTENPSPYEYRVEGSSDKNGPWTTFLTETNPPAGGDGLITKTGVTSQSFYRIITVNGGVESQPGGVFAPSPDPAKLTSVSQGLYLSNANPNSKGVYPVLVSWTKPDADTPAAYAVYRSENPESGFRRITETPVPASAGSGGSFSYTDGGAATVGKYYYYRVLSLNELGQGSLYSETRIGYGALTPEVFFGEFIKTMNNSLDTKLVNMNKPGAMDKLGNETKTGTISGTVDYKTPSTTEAAGAALSGGDIFIEIHYTDYADYYIEKNSALGRYVILDGDSNTRTKSSGDGKMEGTIAVSGMYKGTVNYNNIEIKSQVAAAGYYLVTPDGFPSAAQVGWEKGKRK
jgi:hypothetical protein